MPAIKSLAGRDANNIQELFGIPNFMRRDFGTQLWRYEGEACILNIAMYPQGHDGAHQVLHSETIDKNGKAIDPPLCLKTLSIKKQNFGG